MKISVGTAIFSHSNKWFVLSAFAYDLEAANEEDFI
jgi:hypothetical protein